VELDIDAIADEHTAGLQSLVPLESEILPIERGLRNEAHALVAPWILCSAAGLDVEDDFPRGVADGEISGDAEAIVIQLFDSRAPEPELGELLHVEEVRGAEVGVALRSSRVDAGRVDCHV